MRIALLINYIPPYRVPLFESLTSKVDHVKIFVSVGMEPNRDWPIKWKNLDVKLQKNIMLPAPWKHPSGFLEEIYIHIPYDTISNLIEYSPDVIISAEMGFRSIQSVLYHIFYKKSGFILWAAVSEYTEKGRGFLRKLIRKWLLHYTDVVVVNGKSGANYIEGFGFNSEYIIRSPYTTDFSLFKYFEFPSAGVFTKHVIFIGRLEPRKGLLQFIRCLSKWCENNRESIILFEIVGNGPLYHEIDNYKYPSNLSVKLRGSISYYNLPSVYASAHLLVLPTLADEWGMVVSEAMAVGRPVLGSIYSQAVEELVTDGENGWTFNPVDEDDVYSKLDISLACSIDQLRWMGEQARSVVETHTPEYAANQMIKAAQKAAMKKFA